MNFPDILQTSLASRRLQFITVIACRAFQSRFWKRHNSSKNGDILIFNSRNPDGEKIEWRKDAVHVILSNFLLTII